MSQSANPSQAKMRSTTVKLLIAIMGMGISFIADVYAMISLPDYYIVIGIISLVFLVFTFLLAQSAIKLHVLKNARQEEVYNELFKSSKATYLMMKKSFVDMEDSVNNIGEKVKAPIEEFMGEQKNISEITVNRSKENADALMNSNDKLLDKFFEFETTLESFEEQMLSRQKELMESSVKEITMKQQELSSVIKDTEIEIKKEMLSMSRPMAQPVMQTYVASEAVVQPVAETVSEVSVEPILESEPEMMVEPFVEAEPEISIEPVIEASTIEEPIIKEALMEEEMPAMPDLSDPNKMMSADDIAALIANMGGSEEPVPAQEETEEELIPEIDIFAGEEASMAEEVPAMPDLSDPNKMMSPDDIAALIANMGGSEESAPVQEEPVVEDPIIEEAIAEEKPPMPDLSDPNKMMSPEDIAALLANL